MRKEIRSLSFLILSFGVFWSSCSSEKSSKSSRAAGAKENDLSRDAKDKEPSEEGLDAISDKPRVQSIGSAKKERSVTIEENGFVEAEDSKEKPEALNLIPGALGDLGGLGGIIGVGGQGQGQGVELGQIIDGLGGKAGDMQGMFGNAGGPGVAQFVVVGPGGADIGGLLGGLGGMGNFDLNGIVGGLFKGGDRGIGGLGNILGGLGNNGLAGGGLGKVLGGLMGGDGAGFDLGGILGPVLNGVLLTRNSDPRLFILGSEGTGGSGGLAGRRTIDLEDKAAHVFISAKTTSLKGRTLIIVSEAFKSIAENQAFADKAQSVLAVVPLNLNDFEDQERIEMLIDQLSSDYSLNGVVYWSN